MAAITIITGSTLGSAEYVAEHLADRLTAAGHLCKLEFGPELDELPKKGIWLVISSTHGAGDIPDNLLPFYDALTSQAPDLSAIQFGAIGLGNREYDLFCGAIRKIDQQLCCLGAKRLGDRLEIDVLEHEIPEDPAEVWLEEWLTFL
jgi:MioC protein